MMKILSDCYCQSYALMLSLMSAEAENIGEQEGGLSVPQA